MVKGRTGASKEDNAKKCISSSDGAKIERKSERNIKHVVSLATAVSLCVGILLSGLNIWIWNRQGENLRLDTQKKMAEVYETQPKFDVVYLDMTDSFYSSVVDRSESSDVKPCAFLKNPIFVNEIQTRYLRESGALSIEEWRILARKDKYFPSIIKADMLNSKCDVGARFVTCLAITQEGKRKAVQVELDVDRVALYGVASMYDASDLKSLQEHGVCSKKTLELGDLDTENGVIVPLALSELIYEYVPHVTDPANVERLARGIVYIPRLIRFTDPMTHETKTCPVRQMLSCPLYIDTGLQERG
jgi:hypothetical protein